MKINTQVVRLPNNFSAPEGAFLCPKVSFVPKRPMLYLRKTAKTCPFWSFLGTAVLSSPKIKKCVCGV